jgi:hypothetical protein
MRGCSSIALVAACLLASTESMHLRGFMDMAKSAVKMAAGIKEEDENERAYFFKTDAKINNGKDLVPFATFHSRFNPYDYTTYSHYDNWKDMAHKPLGAKARLKMGLTPSMDMSMPVAKPANMLYNHIGSEMQILHDEYDKKQTMLDIDFTRIYNSESKDMSGKWALGLFWRTNGTYCH